MVGPQNNRRAGGQSTRGGSVRRSGRGKTTGGRASRSGSAQRTVRTRTLHGADTLPSSKPSSRRGGTTGARKRTVISASSKKRMDSRSTSGTRRRKTTTRGGGGAKRGRPQGGSRSKGGRGGYQAGTNSKPLTRKKKEDKIPDVGENLRIIPLGGVEEIGRNMTVFEYKDDIIIVDMGFQFREDSTPGIDYILPNTKYLEDKLDKIRGVVITHGHLDHVGAIPYIMPQIGNPPIYARGLTGVLIKKRQEEFRHLPKLDIRDVETTDAIKLGDMTVRFFGVTHTIPDSMGIIIETPFGDIVHTGDLKLEHKDGVPTKDELERFKIFKDRKVLLLLADSTNVERPGFSIPETIVQKNIDEIIGKAEGRLIIASFASLLERIIKIIETCSKMGKKIVVDGRSMKTNVEVAKAVGMLKEDKSIITLDEMDKYPQSRIVILATGAQGDEFAALTRMSDKRHRQVSIHPGDTVILSSSVVPGNERNVQKLKDNLSRQGVKIIHYQTSDVHSSGHANRDESAWIHKTVNPKYFIPIHGYHYMLTVHADIARELGETPIIPDNSMIMEVQDNGKKFVALKESAPSGLMMVDGFSIGDMQEVVIRDRQTMAQDGMFVVVAIVDTRTGKVRKSPDIISRGFVYLRESQELLHQARIIIKKTIEDKAMGMNPINFEHVKTDVTDNVGRFLLQQTAKRPVVIPVLIGV